jgi:uncharacterized protein YllA (UPF0747 family)
MQGCDRPGAVVVPLDEWTLLHPAAAAAAAGELELGVGGGARRPRSARLADALAEANRGWGNPVDDELSRWLAGADTVVTGQQPGLLGGPLLTLVKACAVAAEVRRLRAAGGEGVGFLWLGTGDDDLPEMGWARVAAGGELLELRADGWERGAWLGGRVRVGGEVAAFLAELEPHFPSEFGREALALARESYGPGAFLGEATARFLARLLAGAGVVLVDALEPELARAGADVVGAFLFRLPEAWRALEDGSGSLRGRGWSPPLRIAPGQLPLFAVEGDRRRRIATRDGACPDGVPKAFAEHPERFVPNAWLRPLLQDAALGTATAFLGGAELAYHVQAAEVWELAGLPRPEWRLRPHVTVVTSAERRLAGQLGVRPEHVLRRSRPAHTLAGAGVRRGTGRFSKALVREFERLETVQREELPALAGDLQATRRKVETALEWWEQRLEAAAAGASETQGRRWDRLRAFLRPDGEPQERRLSVLAPLLRLGLAWPGRLVETLDPDHPGMHLLHWEEGGPW